MGGVSYYYDGDGDRTWRVANAQATLYMLDKQAPLTVILNEQTGSNFHRYIHGPTGILAQQNPNGDMRWMLQDGLQSVRGVSDGVSMLSAQAYSPYGEPLFSDLPTEFGFTGEQTDPLNDLVYLRARYMNPKLGIFGSLDPFEGESSSPLTMNGYGWVEGNIPNLIDATGMASGMCNTPSMTLSPVMSQCNNALTLRCLFNPFGGGAQSAGAFDGDSISGGSTPPEAFAIGIASAFITPLIIASPILLKIVGGGGITGLTNYVEQYSTLAQLPENKDANTAQIMSQINMRKVGGSALYGSLMVVGDMVTGGATRWGTIASGLATAGASAQNDTPIDTFSLFSNSFWGGISWATSSAYNNKVFNKTSGFLEKSIAGAPSHFGIGFITATMQSSVDAIILGKVQSAKNPLAYFFGAGFANWSSMIHDNNFLSWVVTIAANFAYLTSDWVD